MSDLIVQGKSPQEAINHAFQRFGTAPETLRRMIVRQDDTLVCRTCWEDEGGEHVARPAHREAFSSAARGRCDGCGNDAVRMDACL